MATTAANVTKALLSTSSTWACGGDVVKMGLTAISLVPTWAATSKRAGRHQSFSISAIPSEGLVLTRPGAYHLTQNVAVQFKANATAITITGNNVCLDLCDFEVCHSRHSQEFSNTCIGVAVAANTQGVEVRNGRLLGFGLYGVVAVESTDLRLHGLQISGARCRDVATSCAGILLFGCGDSAVTHCSVTDVRVDCMGYVGVNIKLSRNVVVDYCTVWNVRNGSGGATAFAVLGCNDVNVRACRMVDMSTGGTAGPTGHTCSGVLVSLCTAVAVTLCRILNVRGSCDDAHGVAIFVCGSSIRVLKCNIEHVTSGFTPVATGAKATGIEVIGANAVVVEDCVVRTVLAMRPQDLQCAAFAAGTCTDVTFRRCRASHVRCLDHSGTKPKPSADGIGVAFGWGPDPRPAFVKPALSTRYISCYAEHCDVGFDFFMSIGAVLEGCTAKAVRESVRDDPMEARTLTCNACSECTPSLSTRIVNQGHGNVYGHTTLTGRPYAFGV